MIQFKRQFHQFIRHSLLRQIRAMYFQVSKPATPLGEDYFPGKYLEF